MRERWKKTPPRIVAVALSSPDELPDSDIGSNSNVSDRRNIGMIAVHISRGYRCTSFVLAHFEMYKKDSSV